MFWRCANGRVQYTHTYAHTHTYIHTHTYTHKYTHTHIHTHIHINTHTYTHIHTNAHTHRSTHMHIHTHTGTHTNPWILLIMARVSLLFSDIHPIKPKSETLPPAKHNLCIPSYVPVGEVAAWVRRLQLVFLSYIWKHRTIIHTRYMFQTEQIYYIKLC